MKIYSDSKDKKSSRSPAKSTPYENLNFPVGDEIPSTPQRLNPSTLRQGLPKQAGLAVGPHGIQGGLAGGLVD